VAFKITEPTAISFSGGRTSAFLLYKVLEANNGLPDCARVLFCNTGKEDEETLKFIKQCQDKWNVDIVWLEYRAPSEFTVVNFETASRDGEPFEQIIQHRKMLPNTRARFCTVELKIRTMRRYLQSIGWNEWDNMIGIRADEQRRAVKMKPDYKGETPIMPLHKAGLTKADVNNFWAAQDFDLNLQTVNGETIGGNCDLCFLKALPKIVSLVQTNPDRAVWWAKQEEWAATQTNGDGNRFRIDRPKYADIHNFINRQADMFEESIECFCGD
jgi:3'-phosphoadenosine 5'-phosphosulfate sulfotransferase (PAPS reductase)/FAD synthetase